MAHIGFVSTSVLESKDGIDFSEEVRKESDDVLEAERIAKEADKKPLWEQLAGKRDEKQAKFDAVRSAMFAPPRALDDEESTFLQGVEAQRLEAKQRKDKWEAEELRGFAIARANQTVAIHEPKKKPKPKAPAGGAGSKGELAAREAAAAASLPPPPVAIKIKGKRKQKDSKHNKRSKKSQKGKDRSSSSSNPPSSPLSFTHANIAHERSGSLGTKETLPPPPAGGGSSTSGGEKVRAGGVVGSGSEGEAKGLSSLLGAYGSDSDSGGGSNSDDR